MPFECLFGCHCGWMAEGESRRGVGTNPVAQSASVGDSYMRAVEASPSSNGATASAAKLAWFILCPMHSRTLGFWLLSSNLAFRLLDLKALLRVLRWDQRSARRKRASHVPSPPPALLHNFQWLIYATKCHLFAKTIHFK